MESCSMCKTTIDKTPHITCVSCGKTICAECYDKLQDKTHCPICGYEVK